MKLYYVANARMPHEKAHGIQIAKTCESFVARGIDLELVVPRRGKSKKSIQEFYQLQHPIRVRYLPALDLYVSGRVLFALSSFTFMCSYLCYLGWKIVRGEQFSIYSIDMDTFSSTPLMLLPRPVFSELHGARRSNILTRFFFRHITGIIAINEFVAGRLFSVFGMSKSRVLIEQNGVDMHAFGDLVSRHESRQSLGLSSDAPIALYVGRFYPWKELGILAETARLAPEMRWCVVGGTRDEFERVTGVVDTPANLDFFGEKEPHEIPAWVAAADVLLVLGTKRNEDSYKHTSPMKAFEYLAAHRAIVASATPALLSIFSREDAYLYEPDDAESLVRAAHEAVEKKDSAMVERAYQKALTHTWERRAERIMSFMEERSR